MSLCSLEAKRIDIKQRLQACLQRCCFVAIHLARAISEEIAQQFSSMASSDLTIPEVVSEYFPTTSLKVF